MMERLETNQCINPITHEDSQYGNGKATKSRFISHVWRCNCMGCNGVSYNYRRCNVKMLDTDNHHITFLSIRVKWYADNRRCINDHPWCECVISWILKLIFRFIYYIYSSTQLRPVLLVTICTTQTANFGNAKGKWQSCTSLHNEI